ncbi:hypothetical protein ACH3XW_25135 [Acanthocheilonema viteae]
MCWRNKWRKSGSAEIITQSENPIGTQKLKTKELPTPIKMLSVPVMPISFPKKDEDESSAVKVVEIKNKGSSKVSKKSVLSELNTLKDVSHSMPIIDVRHDDKTKNEKFFASAELL